MNKSSRNAFNTGHEQVLNSISTKKIILPTIIGLGVIFYLVSRQLSFEEVTSIRWTGIAFFWIFISIAVFFLRHIMNSWRLRLLSEGAFGWWKSIELVTILEFASAVSPTNFGGSAVAFFLLIQEDISGAKSTAIVIYTIIADTLFFVFSIPLLLLFFGSNIFISTADIYSLWGGLGYTLAIVWIIMAVYGLLLSYGLFIKPNHLKRLLLFLSKWKIFGSTREKIRQAAMDIYSSSHKIKEMPLSFHAKTSVATAMAWICRFFSISAILIALNPSMPQSLYDHCILFGRGEALYAVTAYSPTPGGSGVAEIIFGQFYSEYISPGIAVVGAVLWRMITYYPYLIAGVIIIPNWIRKIINRRREKEMVS